MLKTWAQGSVAHGSWIRLLRRKATAGAAAEPRVTSGAAIEPASKIDGAQDGTTEILSFGSLSVSPQMLLFRLAATGSANGSNESEAEELRVENLRLKRELERVIRKCEPPKNSIAFFVKNKR